MVLDNSCCGDAETLLRLQVESVGIVTVQEVGVDALEVLMVRRESGLLELCSFSWLIVEVLPGKFSV